MPIAARALLLGFAGLALVVPSIAAAAVGEDPPAPAETSPLPPEPAPDDPVITLEVPPEPETITIQVPPLRAPAKKVVAKKVAPKPKAPAPSVQATSVPRRAHQAQSSRLPSRAEVAPAADEPVAKVKPKNAKPKNAKPEKVAKVPKLLEPKVVATVSAPERPVRRPILADGVLAAQFSTPVAATPVEGQTAVLYLSLALAAVLGVLLGLVGAAPRLAGRWPQVFGPVIDATEQIVLAGVCLAGAALTLAITWALTGPGF